MRNEDVPYIVIEKEGSGLGSFVLGALVGAGVALLFAPQSGEETQEEIRVRARRFRDQAEEHVRAAQDELEDRLDRARVGVRDKVDSVRDAVQSGREAAREARVDLERRLDQSKAAYRAGVDAAREVAKSESGNSAGASESDAEGA